MPRFEGALSTSGAFVMVAVEPAAGQPCEAGHESRILGLALLDTGSETSGITRRTAERLSLLTNASMSIGTPIGVDDVRSYWVRIDVVFSASRETRTLQSNLRVFEDQTDWRPQMTGHEVVALLGMDVLQYCQLSLNGPAGTFVLQLD